MFLFNDLSQPYAKEIHKDPRQEREIVTARKSGASKAKRIKVFHRKGHVEKGIAYSEKQKPDAAGSLFKNWGFVQRRVQNSSDTQKVQDPEPDQIARVKCPGTQRDHGCGQEDLQPPSGVIV